MVSFESQSYSKKLLHLISWSHWFTFFNIIAAIGLSTVYLVNEPWPETTTGSIYLVTTWLSHMAFITFITFVLTVFPLTLIFPRTRFIRASASIIFTLVLLLLLLDAFIYNRLGYHINASSTSQILALISDEIEQDRRSFWFVSIIFCLLILSFELVVSNYAWKHLKSLQKTIFARFFIFGLVGCFFISHITHIWADANLEYDVLKQDSILPVSYPSTAKTLLTKYGLFNLEDYIERKTSPLTFSEEIPAYPTLSSQCKVANQQSAYMVLSKHALSERSVHQFKDRLSQHAIALTHHVDNALTDDAWFNLFYGLPTIYQERILAQQTPPALMQALAQLDVRKQIFVIGNQKDGVLPTWLAESFDQVNYLDNVSSLIFASPKTEAQTSFNVIYFTEDDSYQQELYVDALMLAQQKANNNDVIWISSLGNLAEETALTIKPALAIWPNKKAKDINYLTSHMDVANTLLESWLGCTENLAAFSNGSNLLTLKKDRVIANTLHGSIMVFDKDRSVSIDQNGNFESYSRKLAAPISQSADFPLMIDGVHFIKQFSEQAKKAQ